MTMTGGVATLDHICIYILFLTFHDFSAQESLVESLSTVLKFFKYLEIVTEVSAGYVGMYSQDKAHRSI